jgi:hypothetical protein
VKARALLAFVLVLPFMVLEVINRRSFDEGFPFPLFGSLWLLTLAFLLVLGSLARAVSPGRSLLAVVSLIVIAWLWGGIVLDQLPCFLGVPNCD